ncbi:hypothetical protein NX02_21485 [Sphingomonas sanxanigenens DSM 19645 = NX02]|uniref:Uncharacterized protein n=2 Tax=Sphingomonas sanxanigenens TaxID=397260 RepID=W0ADF0_9SPHN|nr:hypothetical protein NX02_21485 [Sphingomonas sanxanigenens DSM 19645 = NX02]
MPIEQKSARNWMLDPCDPLPPTPLTEWEILAVASRMVQRCDCDQFIAERMGLLALLDDADGVATWRAIAMKVRAIRDAPEV